jgi:hypothetical protein
MEAQVETVERLGGASIDMPSDDEELDFLRVRRYRKVTRRTERYRRIPRLKL